MGAGSKTRPTKTGGGILTSPPLGTPILILSVFYSLLLLGTRPPPPLGGGGGFFPNLNFNMYYSYLNLLYNPYFRLLQLKVLYFKSSPISCGNYQMSNCTENCYFACRFMTRHATLLKLIFFSMYPWCNCFVIKECIQQNGYLSACAKFWAKVLPVLAQYRGAHYHYFGMTRPYTRRKLIFWAKYPWYKFSVIKECVQYNAYQRACAEFLAKIFSARSQYRGAHSYLISMSRNSTLPKIIFFSKFLWYDPSVIDECV